MSSRDVILEWAEREVERLSKALKMEEAEDDIENTEDVDEILEDDACGDCEGNANEAGRWVGMRRGNGEVFLRVGSSLGIFHSGRARGSFEAARMRRRRDVSCQTGRP